MRFIGLLVAMVLLAVGLYRLAAELLATRKPRSQAGSPASPGPRAPSESSSPHAGEPSHAPTPQASSEPTSAAPPAAKPPPPPSPAAAQAAKPKPLANGAQANGAAAKDGPLVPSMLHEADSDEDITIITLAPPPDVVAAMNALKATKGKVGDAPAATKAPAPAPAAPAAGPPRIETPPDDDDEDDKPQAVPILYDADASVDEPTRTSPFILVSAAAQTDQGRRRRRNEDSLLVLDDHHLFVVADGMGGHAGGDVASKMAVETIGGAFAKSAFQPGAYPDVPRRGAELAVAIQMANKAIYDHARANAAYSGMGTTVVSARFSPNKERVYFGHVGDSRCYRLRGGQLTQVTTDHTMASQGVTGPLASHLNRAVGVNPAVKVDLIIARPRAEDVYLLCTDGLSKMVPDDQIQAIMNEDKDLDKTVHALIDRANARGGRDNITVILVQVKDAKGFAKLVREKAAAG